MPLQNSYASTTSEYDDSHQRVRKTSTSSSLDVKKSHRGREIAIYTVLILWKLSEGIVEADKEWNGYSYLAKKQGVPIGKANKAGISYNSRLP